MNIIITGASNGIGYETAKLLASQRHNVIALARNKASLEQLKRVCLTENKSATIEIFPFDLENGDYTSLYSFVKNCFKEVNVVINNAGKLLNKSFFDITLPELQSVYSVNVFSVFSLINTLKPLLVKNNSHIVNISSMGGFQGSAKFSGLSAYSSSKGALTILTECMAEEFKPLGVAVNCLCLGAVQTKMLTKAFPGYKAPLSPEDMAVFVSDFSVNGARFFNGKILPISLSTP